MKSCSLLRILPSLATVVCASSAFAGSIPLVTAGNNGGSGGQSGYWANIYIPSTCSITSYVQLNLTQGGGGGVSVTRSNTMVLNFSVYGNYGTYSDSRSATGQPSGYYTVSQGFGGPPYTMSGYISTTLTW